MGLEEVFMCFDPEVVCHLAGLKSINESQIDPLRYYENNVGGSISVIETMTKFNCKK